MGRITCNEMSGVGHGSVSVNAKQFSRPKFEFLLTKNSDFYRKSILFFLHPGTEFFLVKENLVGQGATREGLEYCSVHSLHNTPWHNNQKHLKKHGRSVKDLSEGFFQIFWLV
jgi:hypothetical protein